jgi:hypothetical protein
MARKLSLITSDNDRPPFYRLEDLGHLVDALKDTGAV